MGKKIDNAQVEKMIAKVMKGREVKRDDAIAYMLGVATGRLTALKRYADTVPEGKSSKGVMVPSGRKKRAERSKPVKVAAPVAETEA